METNQNASQEQKPLYSLVSKQYLIDLVNVILELRCDVKTLHAYIEDRETLLDAHDVKEKFGIGRDLLGDFRKEGLLFVRVGRKFFYKSSDIVEFNRTRK